MKGIGTLNGAAASHGSGMHGRTLKVAPVARAVRAALAGSAAMLALAGSGPALAGDCTVPVDNTIRCNGDFTDTLNFAVEDLTLVVGDETPTSIAPPSGNAGILADWSGHIGVSSSADITTRDADGIDAIGNGDIDISNDGNIGAYGFGQTIGLYAYSDGGDASIANDGAIVAYSSSGLADGIFASGADVAVANHGLVAAAGVDWAAGIEAQGDDAATVVNDGTVYARSYGPGQAFGVYTTGGDGGASIDNSSLVVAHGYDQATGLHAQADGGVDITNSGGVYAGYIAYVGDNLYSSSDATAVFAASGAAGAAVDVHNAGLLQAISFSASSGVDARSTGAGGTADVHNAAYVVAAALAGNGIASGLSASADGDASIGNDGDIFAYAGGTAYGAIALSFNGDANVSNAGDIATISTAFSDYSAYGIVSSSQHGAAGANNAGTISVDSAYIGVGMDVSAPAGASAGNDGGIDADAWVSYGVRVHSGGGDVAVENGGSIAAHYSGTDYLGYAFGLFAGSGAGDIAIRNDGDIVASGGLQGIGVFARATAGAAGVSTGGHIAGSATYGNAYGALLLAGTEAALQNAGTIAAEGGYTGVGAQLVAQYGDVAITNAGDIEASGADQAMGAVLRAYGGTYPPPSSRPDAYYDAVASVTNSGSINAFSAGFAAALNVAGPNVAISNSGDLGATGDAAFGVLASGAFGTSIANTGDIVAHGGSYAFGIRTFSPSTPFGYFGSDVHNAGHVSAVADDGVAIGASLEGGALDNSGSIVAQAGGTTGYALGVDATYGSVTNSGTISASHHSEAVGVLVGSFYGGVTVENSGTIRAETEVGSDAIAVLAVHDLEVENTGSVFGAISSLRGDSTILVHNGDGGLWRLQGLANLFGDGDDAIMNDAGAVLHLANGAILMEGSGAGGNRFENAGILRASGDNLVDMGRGPVALVPSLNPLPLVNDGIIDFVDGSPDDLLVVLGDLGGDGAIHLDMSPLNGSADLLYVDGSVVDGTTQAINLHVDGVPTALTSAAAPVVEVTGDLPAGSFVGGSVLNADPRNFLDLGVSVGTASAGGLHVVSAAVTVDGLNDTGVLAASVAQGAHSLINSAIGTLRQRQGVQSPLASGQSGQSGLSPWVRLYTDKGDSSPEGHGFGSGADFGFEQENRGRELGMGFTLGRASVGVLAGNADGTQRLTGGTGSDRLKLHGAGVYATWTEARFYVDASYRWMDFDARLDSASGERETSGNASATNLEAGLTGGSFRGVDIVPQVQYTRSKIDNVGAIEGSLTRMDIDGGVSERGRVGVALSRTFAGARGFEWTPYGSLSAVREFDGEAGFTVGDAFTGTTSVEGTSTLAELGIGVRRGGWAATAGVHWSDGGAVDSVRGGQLLVRYTW